MRRFQRFGWVLILLLLMGVVGWIIFWAYELRLRSDWESKANNASQRMERALLDTQLQLGVLAESIVPLLASGQDAAALVSQHPLVKRLGVSEIVLRSPTEERVLYSTSGKTQPGLWRGSLYDFFHAQTPQAALELTEYGPRVLDIEPVQVEGQTKGLEVALNLQYFIDNFARREGVEVAFLVPEDRAPGVSLPVMEASNRARYKVLCSSSPAITDLLGQKQLKRNIGRRTFGMAMNATSAFAVVTLDDMEYSSTLLPAVGGASSMVMWMDYSRTVAQLADERRVVLWYTWVVMGVSGGLFAFFVLRYRWKLRWQLVEVQDTLRGANEKLKAEVVSRQKTEESLRGIADEMYASRQSDVELLKQLSHLMKLNASATLGFVELLKAEAPSADTDSIDSLHQLGERLLFMGENLGLWAQRETGRREFPLSAHPLEDVVGSAVSSVVAVAARKKIKITPSLEERLMVKCDPSLLESALKNILMNSIKYSPRNAQIEVSARLLESGVELVVADAGVGIPRNIMETLFSRNSRQSIRGIEGEEGLGIGLLIVKWVAESHDAQLRVTSDEGQGCRVQFVFPPIRPLAARQG